LQNGPTAILYGGKGSAGQPLWFFVRKCIL
jgi:hypothetical protein